MLEWTLFTFLVSRDTYWGLITFVLIVWILIGNLSLFVLMVLISTLSWCLFRAKIPSLFLFILLPTYCTYLHFFALIFTIFDQISKTKVHWCVPASTARISSAQIIRQGQVDIKLSVACLLFSFFNKIHYRHNLDGYINNFCYVQELYFVRRRSSSSLFLHGAYFQHLNHHSDAHLSQ